MVQLQFHIYSPLYLGEVNKTAHIEIDVWYVQSGLEASQKLIFW